ncbi:MAG: tRNA (adenosine(37)-N6)-threonylcarbamoyltransferase complex ATPase subunit type 1 TsaE [Geobacter sp.]|nr:tRNA (adenosine(37)-N6)-threonylcarbamoyltransferase complex ATPase subunit type 1 TsaE [Geobacter sp.]
MTELVTLSAEDTHALGAALGQMLVAGDFIALIGDLGAGKTHFVKGVAAGLGVTDDDPVTSPTYTLLNIYTGRIHLYHFDLYRLSGAEQVDDLGFAEYFSGDGVCLVEWAERLGDILPSEHLSISFFHSGDDRRRLVFSAAGVRAEMLMRDLLAVCQ